MSHFWTFVFIGALLATSPARAQEALPWSGADSALPDRSGRPFDGGDDLSGRDSGGLFSGGGQKPLQRVRSIPLPQARGGMGATVTASASPRESSPVLGYRRSKPQLSELTTDFPARMIYLNGKNISAVRDQQLEGVTVRIDAHGNVHISAPHYEVQESTHYRPLLPGDVPRVSKPSVPEDEPLLLGRQKKAEALPETQNGSNSSPVPPVPGEQKAMEESGAASGKDISTAKDKPSGANKPPAEGQKL
ncbi:MAG: hypothetical protein RIR26_852 [Pseudomonadota bacterium]|jgi:hypothetical protein